MILTRTCDSQIRLLGKDTLTFVMSYQNLLTHAVQCILTKNMSRNTKNHE